MSHGCPTIRRSCLLFLVGSLAVLCSGTIQGDDRVETARVKPLQAVDVAADVHKLVEADWIDSDRRFGIQDTAAPAPVKTVTTVEDAAGACDGVKNGLWGFHVASGETDPWWQVDLGKECRLDRVVVYWHFRTRWPEKCFNFNVIGDVRAARTIFHSPLPFVLFDTGTYLRVPMEESECLVRPHGELGRYLHDYRLTSAWFQDPRKGFYDLGDIAALVDPSLACWEVTDCPEVGWDLGYQFKGTMGRILRCYHVDRDRTFGLLYAKLANLTP